MEIAQEMVKVHSFTPARMNDSELKMIPLNHRISVGTPVGLPSLIPSSSTITWPSYLFCSLSVISPPLVWYCVEQETFGTNRDEYSSSLYTGGSLQSSDGISGPISEYFIQYRSVQFIFIIRLNNKSSKWHLFLYVVPLQYSCYWLFRIM